MTVYLGESGRIELARLNPGKWVLSELTPSDVNIDRKRFSVDFAYGTLITGDLVEIACQDNQNDLVLVAGHNFPDWTGWINVDPIGGLRLYNNFADALQGKADNALALEKDVKTQQIKFQTQTDNYRCLAEVTSFDMTTSRESVNTTSLCQEFVEQYEAGLISGQGRISAFWQHIPGICREDDSGSPSRVEFPVYLARLLIRLQQGAKFRGKFFIYRNRQEGTSIFYLADCILTNCQVVVEATELITTEIEFVTSGPIILGQDADSGYLLQESGSKIELESNQDGFLLQDDG